VTRSVIQAADVAASDRRLEQKKGARPARGLWNRRPLVWLCRTLLLLAFLVLWEEAVAGGFVKEVFVSRPTSVAHFLTNYFISGDVWVHLGTTMYETVLGFIIGSLLGLGVGVVLTQVRVLDDLLRPFLTALNAMPRVALAPLFILWFGIGESPKVYLAVSLVFFIVMLNTQAGIRSVPDELLMTSKVMGSSKRQTFIKVLLPASVPAMFAGLRLSVVYSLLGVVVGEMLSGRAGLGVQVTYFSQTFNSAGLFGVLLLLAFLGVILSTIMETLERRLLRWDR